MPIANPVYVVEAVRTAVGVGKAGKGSLSNTRADLSSPTPCVPAPTARRSTARSWRTSSQAASPPWAKQGFNIARIAALIAGFPVRDVRHHDEPHVWLVSAGDHTAANAIAAERWTSPSPAASS